MVIIYSNRVWVSRAVLAAAKALTPETLILQSRREHQFIVCRSSLIHPEKLTQSSSTYMLLVFDIQHSHGDPHAPLDTWSSPVSLMISPSISFYHINTLVCPQLY